MHFTFVSFCWIKAPSVCSDYCRAVWHVGCGIGSGPGRNGLRQGGIAPARALPNSKSVWGSPHQPAVATNFRGATRGLPLDCWMTSTRPGFHGALGNGGWTLGRTKVESFVLGKNVVFMSLSPPRLACCYILHYFSAIQLPLCFFRQCKHSTSRKIGLFIAL